MNRETLDKGNKLQAKIDFLQKKSDALYNACRTLIQEKAETVTEEQMTSFVRQLMESFEGCMALTDIVKVVTDDYKHKIKEYEKAFDQL